MSKKLIINADDFGLSAGTNAAIIACHQAGSVTSTTLMVNMPAAEQAAELAKAHPELGVGLHFNLTLGRAVSSSADISSLVNFQGFFSGRGAMEKRAIAARIKPGDVARELQAQVSRFEGLGLTLTHIDSHQHVHLLPGVFDVVAKFCAQQGLPLRIPWVWPHATGSSFKRRLRQWMLKKLIRRNMIRWSGALNVNQGLASVFDLGLLPTEISIEAYRQILQQNTTSPLELMVHPALVDDVHREMTDISAVSEREYALLANCSLGQMASDLGYEVTHFGRAFAGFGGA